MVAKRRRMAIRDLLLVTVSGAVIVLALWPAAPPRQTVLLRDRSGMMQSYSLAVGDPELGRLRAEVDRRAMSVPDSTLALAMWRVEMADFYAAQTKPKSSAQASIRRVSFSDQPPTDIQPTDAALWQAQHEHWVRLAEAARQDVINVQGRIDRMRALVDAAPIQFGDRISGEFPREAFVAALLAGLLLATLFAAWAGLCPEVTLQSARPNETAEGALSSGTSRRLQFAIPASWVRVHQPSMVVMRRVATFLIVATALALVPRL